MYKWQANGTIESCKDHCRGRTLCVAFSYWHNSSKCDTVVIRNDADIAYVTYTIEEVSSDAAISTDVTHGHKGPYQGKYSEFLSFSANFVLVLFYVK